MVVFERPTCVDVPEAEYHRLLGWPRDHEPSGRGLELAAAARAWYATNGRPWVAFRQVPLRTEGDAVVLDGERFAVPRLAAHLRAYATTGAVLLAASAGPECEAEAAAYWQAGRPDDYYFLEVYGSAVVEALISGASGRICLEAQGGGLRAVPHYAPGYSGWDVAEQVRLHDLLVHGLGASLPGPLEVLSSGMLRPKKSLLAVVGLSPVGAPAPGPSQPCERCSFSPCTFRRVPYRWTAAAEPSYRVPVKALRKWSQERLELRASGDDRVEALFRFEGSTCSNLGYPLAFHYALGLRRRHGVWWIESASSTPLDDGYLKTCRALEDTPRFLREVAASDPAPGSALTDLLSLDDPVEPSGCLCTPGNRRHKWRLALETISYALSQSAHDAPPAPTHAQTLLD
jgi:hypothetical protein